jgi:site-specific DNA recombinase
VSAANTLPPQQRPGNREARRNGATPRRPRFCVYLRISRDPDGQSTAPERQLEDCRKFADLRGWDIVDVFEDRDLSAFDRDVIRPRYEEMLPRLHEYDGVLVWRLDRLVRRTAEFTRFWARAENAGEQRGLGHPIRLASATQPIDTSDPVGMLIVTILVAFAQMESETNSVRTKRKYDELAALGLPKGTGNARGFGYSCNGRHLAEGCDKEGCERHCDIPGCQHDNGMSIIPDEAELLLEAGEHVLSPGGAVANVCRRWNAEGVRRPQGGKVAEWTPDSVRLVLTGARQAGLRVHRGVVVGPAAWPAIFDDDAHTKLVNYFENPERKHGPRGPRSIYAGLFVNTDGLKLWRARASKSMKYQWRTRTPRFPGEEINHVSMSAEPLEELVRELLFQHVESGELARRREERRKRALAKNWAKRDDPAELQRDLDELARMQGEGELTLSEFIAARTPLYRRLNEALAARQAADPSLTVLDDLDDLRRRWDAEPGDPRYLSDDRKRAILRAVFEGFVIHPSKRVGRGNVDLDRVEPIWRA